MRRLICFIFLTVFAFVSATNTARAAEFRGLFVDAFHPGFKTHEQVTQMVNAAKAANFNVLVVQVRKRGDAYYNSHVEPKAADIAPDYDPLADIIRQAHAAGLEVHAWLTVYEVSHESYTLPSTHVASAHPDWITQNPSGVTALDGGKICLDPALPEVQSHFLSIVADLLKNYEVDGLNLDGVRYPNTTAGYNPTIVQSGVRQDRDAQD